MRGIILTTILALFAGAVFVGPARAQTEEQVRDCFVCGFEIAPDEAVVWYGGKPCCSEECRREHHLSKFKCKICNDQVEPESESPVRYDGVHTWVRIGAPPQWDGYCDFCREGVENGSIDPVADLYRPETQGGEAPVATPTEAAPTPESGEPEPEESSVGDYLSWAAGICVVLFFVIKKLFA